MHIYRRIIFCGVAAVLLFALSVYLRDFLADAELKKQGNRIVQKIEQFQETHGRLPSSLSEAGILDEGPIYYEKRDEDEYVVWYGKRLGESEMYNSKEKAWALRD